jgi:hypothetical protein
MKTSHSNTNNRRPRIAVSLVLTVVALQVALLATLGFTTRWQPPRVRVFEAIWAWVANVSFYPMLLLLIGGPVITWLAFKLDRRKVGLLFIAWAAFGVTLIMAFGTEAQAMLLTLWQQLPWVG